MIPTTIPHGRTARRLEWTFLPPHLRRQIEERCGSPVVDARSMGTGFTPGFASVLTCADGSRHFVKAASLKAQRPFAEAYRVEAGKLAALPADVPAPPLLWTIDDEWVVLATEYVEARHPQRPWRQDDLDSTLDVLERTAATLTPPPVGLAVDDFATEFADWPAFWERIRAAHPDLEHADEAAELAARYAEVVAGSTVVHTDVRDDNILLATDGRVLLCDWNWPTVGAAWLDTVLTLIGPRGDGIDVETVLAVRPLTRDVPAEHVDIFLALVAGYFLHSCEQPVPPTSPHVREVQRWQGAAVWGWLGERRGWV